MSAAVERLTAELSPATGEVGRLRAALAAAHAIIEGRTTPPTDAEITAHHAAGGSWLVAYGRTHDVIDIMRGARATRDRLAETGAVATWWALDERSRPCALPVVEVTP